MPLKVDYELPATKSIIEVKIVEDDDTINNNAVDQVSSKLRKRSSLANFAQFQNRRRESLSLFTLTSSKQKKLDYLNKLYDEKIREQDELNNLLKTSSKLLASSQKQKKLNSPTSQICFTTNTYEAYCINKRRSSNVNLAQQSTNNLMFLDNDDNNRRRSSFDSDNISPVKDLAAPERLNFFVLMLLRAGFISKRVIRNFKQNIKIYLFILFLFSVILASILFSLFRLVNKLKKKNYLI